LLALALASLLTTESPVVLYRVYNIFLNIAETLNDITRPDENGGGGVDSLMAGVTDSILDTDDIDYETEHDSRYTTDEVRYNLNVCVSLYMGGSLTHCRGSGCWSDPHHFAGSGSVKNNIDCH
jgi:hypothetical protein